MVLELGWGNNESCLPSPVDLSSHHSYSSNLVSLFDDPFLLFRRSISPFPTTFPATISCCDFSGFRWTFILAISFPTDFPSFPGNFSATAAAVQLSFLSTTPQFGSLIYMFPTTASPSGISCALSLTSQTALTHHYSRTREGAWRCLCQHASTFGDVPSSHTYHCSLGPFWPHLTWSLFCNLFVFQLLSFVAGTVCLSFSCILMADSGSCENFRQWFATATYLQRIFVAHLATVSFLECFPATTFSSPLIFERKTF